MSIEIKGINNLPIQDTGTAKVQKDKGKPAEPGTVAEHSDDSVELTNHGRRVSELASKVDKISEVDQQKVEAIKKAIASGEYKIDAKGIASKMLQLESLLPK